MGAVLAQAGLVEGPPRSLSRPPLVLMKGFLALLAYSQVHLFLPGPETGKSDEGYTACLIGRWIWR